MSLFNRDELNVLLSREATIIPYTTRLHFFRCTMTAIDDLLRSKQQDKFDKVLEFPAIIEDKSVPIGSVTPGLAELLDHVEGTWRNVFERLRSNAVFARRIRNPELIGAFLYFALQHLDNFQ